MATRKVLVGTGCTSALGLVAIRKLLANPANPPYTVILGCRNVEATRKAYDESEYDKSKHELVLLPLDVADLAAVKKFQQKTVEHLDKIKIDTLFLNAGAVIPADKPNKHNSKWSETAVINHFSNHYLVHLLKDSFNKNARVVFVSSGALQMVKEVESLESTLKTESNADTMKLYAASKFVALLNAIWWRRQFQSAVSVVAVSPGLIPGTGLGRHTGKDIPANSPGAKTVDAGAQSLLNAFDKDGQPEDPNAVYLASWGSWWDPAKEFPLACSEQLQNKWSPSVEEMEKDAKL